MQDLQSCLQQLLSKQSWLVSRGPVGDSYLAQGINLTSPRMPSFMVTSWLGGTRKR